MTQRTLVAKRINYGQSESEPGKRRTVTTSGILYPVRTRCSPEEAASFTATFDQGETIVPKSITETLISDFKVTA